METSSFQLKSASYIYIDSSQLLERIFVDLKKNSYLILDTEFKREKTYYPELGLIQIASLEKVFIIDPLSQKIDFSPLYDLLVSPRVLKVVHAGYEDVEIFFHKMGQVLCPLFDTQIAAQFCGFENSISYHKLAQELCGVDLDKSQQRTDWIKRPLTESQLHYAALDVIYLKEIYNILVKKLQEKGRLSWVLNEMECFFTPQSFQKTPADLWKRFKNLKKSPSVLYTLQELLMWREKRAQNNNLPRLWLLSDADLIQIAEKHPKDVSQITSIKPLGRYFKTQDAENLLKCLNALIYSDQSKELPQHHFYGYSQNEKELLKELKHLLLQEAERHNMCASLIATQRDLEQFVRDETENTKILTSWRYGVFGKAASDLKEAFKKKSPHSQ